MKIVADESVDKQIVDGLGKLPPRGAFYIALGVKVADSSGSVSRAMAFVPKKKP